MTNQPGITLTGADERTSLEDLVRLVELDPAVEIGLLYSETPEGRNRYPSAVWLAETVLALGSRCAVHVCGRAARAASMTTAYRWTCRAGRVQINGLVARVEVEHAVNFFPEVITQHNALNLDLTWLWAPAHALLVDASGGRGLSPAAWHRPDTAKPVGFAGGLAPENLAAELPRIMAVAQGAWWIDLETSLRVDDWFAVARAAWAVEVFLAATKEAR